MSFYNAKTCKISFLKLARILTRRITIEKQYPKKLINQCNLERDKVLIKISVKGKSWTVNQKIAYRKYSQNA